MKPKILPLNFAIANLNTKFAEIKQNEKHGNDTIVSYWKEQHNKTMKSNINKTNQESNNSTCDDGEGHK